VKFSLKNPEKKTTIKLEKFSRQLQHDVKISKLPGGLSKRYQPLQSFKRMLGLLDDGRFGYYFFNFSWVFGKICNFVVVVVIILIRGCC